MVSAFCGGVSNNRRWKGDRYIDNRSRRSICKTAVNGVVVVRFPTEAGPAFVRTSAGFDEPTTAETAQGVQATLNSILLPLLNSPSLFPWPPACLVDGPDAPWGPGGAMAQYRGDVLPHTEQAQRSVSAYQWFSSTSYVSTLGPLCSTFGRVPFPTFPRFRLSRF